MMNNGNSNEVWLWLITGQNKLVSVFTVKRNRNIMGLNEIKIIFVFDLKVFEWERNRQKAKITCAQLLGKKKHRECILASKTLIRKGSCHIVVSMGSSVRPLSTTVCYHPQPYTLQMARLLTIIMWVAFLNTATLRALAPYIHFAPKLHFPFFRRFLAPPPGPCPLFWPIDYFVTRLLSLLI